MCVRGPTLNDSCEFPECDHGCCHVNHMVILAGTCLVERWRHSLDSNPRKKNLRDVDFTRRWRQAVVESDAPWGKNKNKFRKDEEICAHTNVNALGNEEEAWTTKQKLCVPIFMSYIKEKAAMVKV